MANNREWSKFMPFRFDEIYGGNDHTIDFGTVKHRSVGTTHLSANCTIYTDTLVGGFARIYETLSEPCGACDGRGCELEDDVQGEGAWAMSVTFIHACEGCSAFNLCPGCLVPVPEQYTPLTDHIETFTCTVCGWTYDEERFEPDDPEPDYYDLGYDSMPW